MEYVAAGAVSDLVVANQTSGGSGRRGTPGLTRRVGPSRRPWGGVAVPWCGACRVLGQPRLQQALPCSCTRQLGRRLGAAIVRLAHGLRSVRLPAPSLPCPPGLGARRSTTSGQGRPTSGPRGPGVPCRQPRRGRLWLTADLPSGCAPSVVITSAPTRSGRRPESTTNGPCECRRWRGKAHPATSSDRGGPTHSRAGKCALQPHRGLSVRSQVFPAHPGASNAARVHNRPCRVGLAAAGYPPAVHLARQPAGREQPRRRGPQWQVRTATRTGLGVAALEWLDLAPVFFVFLYRIIPRHALRR